MIPGLSFLSHLIADGLGETFLQCSLLEDFWHHRHVVVQVQISDLWSSFDFLIPFLICMMASAKKVGKKIIKILSASCTIYLNQCNLINHIFMKGLLDMSIFTMLK